VLVFVFLSAGLFWFDFITSFSVDVTESDEVTAEGTDNTEPACNIAGFELRGDLVTYIPKKNGNDDESDDNGDQTASEVIVNGIENISQESSYKGVLLEVDSYGDSPVAAEEIANALKKYNKPTVAWIREGGTSGAYWAATGADFIVASQNSDVGSIGVTYSYVDSSKKNEKEGLTYNQLSSGRFKDAGDANKPLTSEERKLAERDIGIIYENFVHAVAENRKIPIETVRLLADGSSLLGEMALNID